MTAQGSRNGRCISRPAAVIGPASCAGKRSDPRCRRPAPRQHDTAPHHHAGHSFDTPVHKPAPKGVAFVEAAIKPLNYELEERWWGWRPNDIIDLTDNVNNFRWACWK
jgi:hypothetical protein